MLQSRELLSHCPLYRRRPPSACSSASVKSPRCSTLERLLPHPKNFVTSNQLSSDNLPVVLEAPDSFLCFPAIAPSLRRCRQIPTKKHLRVSATNSSILSAMFSGACSRRRPPKTGRRSRREKDKACNGCKLAPPTQKSIKLTDSSSKKKFNYYVSSYGHLSESAPVLPVASNLHCLTFSTDA
jgi:hypothetical protein